MAEVTYNNKKGGWTVVWVDPIGQKCSRLCGRGSVGREMATSLAEQVEEELRGNHYVDRSEQTWVSLLKEYERLRFGRIGPAHQENMYNTLKHFERICRPHLLRNITTKTIDQYALVRGRERGLHGLLANTTLNKELACLNILFRCAHRWGMILRMPYVEKMAVRESERFAVTPEEFTLMWRQTHMAIRPNWPGISTSDWWRAFLLWQFLTGWRLSQVLSVEFNHISWENENVLSPWSVRGNKASRDIRIPLHPRLMDAIRPLRNTGGVLRSQRHLLFSLGKRTPARIFPPQHRLMPRVEKMCPLDQRSLYVSFNKIQYAAGVSAPNGNAYTFHDIRRGCATANADRLDIFELQTLMQHTNINTTRKYVAMGRKIKSAINNKLLVPNLDEEEP